MKFRQYNPVVLQLPIWQWCNREQQGYDTEISFELVAHHKYHALLPNLRLFKKGIILDIHISYVWYIWGMSVQNMWHISDLHITQISHSVVTLPTFLTKYCIWNKMINQVKHECDKLFTWISMRLDAATADFFLNPIKDKLKRCH
jgi:hypothetical protein